MAKFKAEDPKNLSATYGASRWSLFAGDQLKVADLLAVHKARGDWDVVVDDGGHTMLMQINTLRTLLPLLVPGGLYALEDFHTSHVDWTVKDGPGGVLARGYFIALTHELHVPGAMAQLSGNEAVMYEGVALLAPLIKSIDCTPQCCTLTRWLPEERAFEETGVWKGGA